MQFTIPTPPYYSFKAMIDAHGWAQLQPFSFDAGSLVRVEQLPNGNVVHLTITPSADGIEVEVAGEMLSNFDRDESEEAVRWMLELDEDFAEFYTFCQDHAPLQHIPSQGLGPMLRGSTVWEDYVKTVYTTNTTWAQTKAMVGRTVNTFGAPLEAAEGLNAFPPAKAIAAASPDEFADAVRAGYRAPYIHATAVDIVEGRLDLEAWKDDAKDIDTPTLMKELQKLRGIGPYGAAHMALLLGSYGHVPVDSWARSLMQKHIRGGEPVTNNEVHEYFAQFGAWKALAFRCWRWE